MTTYRSSKPVCSSRGETSRHTRKELLASPHREVRAGAMTGRSFVFGGVVFEPEARSTRTQPDVADRYAMLMADEFARSCDLAPQAPSTTCKRPAERAAGWQYAAAVVVIIAIAGALGLGVRVADTVAHDSWDPRKETRQ